MRKPSELDALKEQLDSLLDNRLGHISSDEDQNSNQTTSDIAQRPAPEPQNTPDQPVEARKVNDAEDIAVLRKALDGVAGPLIVYGDDYRIIFANKIARELWPVAINGIESGQTVLEASANQIKTLLPAISDAEAIENAKRMVARHNSAKPREVLGTGGRWYSLHHDKVDGEYVCAIGVDITDLKTHEQQLKDAQKAADDANTAKSAFLARMSHEIKTPLNAIIGMSDAMIEDSDDPEVLETFEYIVTAAEGLSHVLGQTLDHAKLMSEKVVVELENHSMRETIRKVAGMWKKPCDKKNLKLNIHLHNSVPDGLVFDRFRFQQCLNNILSNAVKFTEKGHITVAAKILEKSNASPMVAVVVQDSGVGMSEEARSRVFNAYEQAEASTTRLFGGTGLGLSITKQLVEAMGGSISVQSDLGKGTAFLMLIPADLEVTVDPVDDIAGNMIDKPVNSPVNLAKPELTMAEAQKTPEEEPETVELAAVDAAPETELDTPFEGLSVLCVEDNPVNHAVIQKLIGKQVKSIAFAHNGEEGLKALETQNFDVVLMDIHMPIMDGIEATLKIRGSDKPWADVIIIAVTADPDFQYQRVCRNIGMNDAIGKPVKRQDILDSIARSLDCLKETHAQRVELPIAV